MARLRPTLDDYQAAVESLNEFRFKPAGLLRLTAARDGASAIQGRLTLIIGPPLRLRCVRPMPQLGIEAQGDAE